MPAVAFQFGMADDPCRMRSPATLTFLRTQSAQAAILSDRELRLADSQGKLPRGVPLPRLRPLDEDGQHGFDVFKPLFKGHRYFSHLPTAPLVCLGFRFPWLVVSENILNGFCSRRCPLRYIPVLCFRTRRIRARHAQ